MLLPLFLYQIFSWCNIWSFNKTFFLDRYEILSFLIVYCVAMMYKLFLLTFLASSITTSKILATSKLLRSQNMSAPIHLSASHAGESFSDFGFTIDQNKTGKGLLYIFFDRQSPSGCFWKMLPVITYLLSYITQKFV